MKIAVIGANGKLGKIIVKEALDRGHGVTGIIRNASRTAELEALGAKVLVKDLFNLTYNQIKDCEVIISAISVNIETAPQFITAAHYLRDLLSGKGNRLIVVSGTTSLYVNPEHTKMFFDTHDFGKYLPIAQAHIEAVGYFRKVNDVRWSVLCPAKYFQYDGVRSGKYILAGEELTLNSEGQSVISYADYAIATLDEAEQGKHVGKRFSVVADY